MPRIKHSRPQQKSVDATTGDRAVLQAIWRLVYNCNKCHRKV